MQSTYVTLINLLEYSKMMHHSRTDPLIDGTTISFTTVDQFFENIHQNLALAAYVSNEFGC